MPWRIFLVFEETPPPTAVLAFGEARGKSATSEGVATLPPTGESQILSGVVTRPEIEQLEALLRRLTLGPLNTLDDIRIALQDVATFVNELAVMGIIRRQQSGEQLQPGQVVYLDEAAFWRAADSSSSARAPTSGYGVVASIAPPNTPVDVVSYGELDTFSGLVPGRTYYLGANGSVTLDPDQPIVVAVGRALTDKVMLVQPQYIGDTVNA